MREFKVVILGPGGVGKSALTVQFISGKFVERYDPTVEDFYRKEIEVDGDPAILEILDTAGTEQFASMRDLYIKNGQGFIIVYSLTSKQSFQDVKLIREQIIRVKGTDRVPILLAANKCDIHQPYREVSTDEGCNLANDWSVPYMETSAKNSTIVNSLFTEIVKEMNIKSNNHQGSNRKEKKKSKKILNNTIATNKTIVSTNSSSTSSSPTLTSNKDPATKFKTNTGNPNCFINSLSRACFCCCRTSFRHHNNSKSNNSSDEIYNSNDSSNEKFCSIL